MPHFALAWLLLTGCTETLTGTLSGEVPDGATVALLWPGGALGTVGGIGEVDGKDFELVVRPPEDSDHPGVLLGTLVIYDGELEVGDGLSLDDIDGIVGAAPQHTIVDSNSTCSGLNCEKDDTFDRGIQCGACDFDGCVQVACKQVELVATDTPLSLDWRWPTVEPEPGWWTEDGQVIAHTEPTLTVFTPGQVGGPVFRDDDDIASVEGVHVGAERVTVRIEDSFGKVRGLMRNFDGAPLLELREDGNNLLDGPVISPDGAWLATAWADGSVRIYAASDGALDQQTTIDGATAVHWSPASDVIYAMTALGSPAVAVPLALGAQPIDYPECFDGPPSSTLDQCGPLGEGATVGTALGHPILLDEPCAGIRFADVPRSLVPTATRLCTLELPTGTTAR